MNTEKLLIIGLDGANRAALVKGMNQGKLPNFKEIAETGSISTLKSPLPPVTPVSMASMLTGNSPGEHGVFGFEEGTKRTDNYVDYNSIDSRTLFDYMEKAGKDLITVNVPMTSPLPDETDIGVSGFPIKDSKFAKPYPVREKLRDTDYRVEPSRFDDDKDEFITEVFDLAEKRFKVSQDLIMENWDVFFLMFTGDARLQHYIDDKEAIEEFYTRIDTYLGKLTENIDEEIEVLIVSDHGFSDLETRFDIGEWLIREGYMEAGESDTSELYGKLDLQPGDSTAYPGGAYLGNLYADEDVKDEIVEKLSDLEYKGQKVFRDVFLSEELYGENNGPDIIPVPRRGMSYVAGYSDELFSEDIEEKKVPDREGVLITTLDIPSDRVKSEEILPRILEVLKIDGDT